jgi:hypothetical protein
VRCRRLAGDPLLRRDGRGHVRIPDNGVKAVASGRPPYPFARPTPAFRRCKERKPAPKRYRSPILAGTHSGPDPVDPLRGVGCGCRAAPNRVRPMFAAAPVSKQPNSPSGNTQAQHPRNHPSATSAGSSIGVANNGLPPFPCASPPNR